FFRLLSRDEISPGSVVIVWAYCIMHRVQRGHRSAADIGRARLSVTVEYRRDCILSFLQPRSDKQMKILFFVQFFYPSREIGAKRPSEMAKYCIAQGHNVDVLCAKADAPWHETQQRAFTASKIIRVAVPPDVISSTWRLLKRLKKLLRLNRASASRAAAS